MQPNLRSFLRWQIQPLPQIGGEFGNQPQLFRELWRQGWLS